LILSWAEYDVWFSYNALFRNSKWMLVLSCTGTKENTPEYKIATIKTIYVTLDLFDTNPTLSHCVRFVPINFLEHVFVHSVLIGTMQECCRHVSVAYRTS
jgi:hypothetical protein